MVDLLKGTTPYCSIPIDSTFEAEQEFHYSDAGFCIVQLLIEDTTGSSFSTLMTDVIFRLLAMTNSFFLPQSQLPIQQVVIRKMAP